MKKTLLISLLIVSYTVKSQEAQPLLLKDVITYALENKADAKKAKLKVENSAYQIQEVKSRALPQITANGGLTYNPILQTNVIDAGAFGGAAGQKIQVAFGQSWISTAGISLTQALFDQTVFTGLKAAKSTREFYLINEQLTEEQVIERVANNYYQVYVQRQKRNVIETAIANTNKVKDIIKGQLDNGLAKKIDLDRILVKLSNFNTLRQQIINGVQLQENALKFFMGMPIATPIIIPSTEFQVLPQTVTTIPNTANRSEYLLLKKSEQLLDYQKQAIKAGYYPTLSLVAGYNFIGQGAKIPWGAKPVDGVYWSDFSVIGLNLKVPIFSGFGTLAKVKQAEINLQSVKLDLIDTKLALDIAYENAKTQMENSLIAINNQKENTKLAQEVLDNSRNNYLQGLASLTDLLDAENALTETQNNYTTSILDYKLAEIQVIKSKGELKTLINTK